jgi:hypothetical protein
MLTRTVIATGAVLAAGIILAAPASADPADNPCEFAINYFCKFIPLAPDLEGDIDLTKDRPPVDPNAPPPESLPVVDPCAAGCI